MCIKLREIETLRESNNDFPNCGIMSHKSGDVLLNSYMYQLTNKKKYSTRLNKDLERIFDSMGTYNYVNSFCGGIAGLGWLVEDLVSRDFIETDTNELLEELDTQLYEWMISQQKQGNYDYMHGALGAGLYFLKRLNSNPKLESVVVELLDILISQKIVFEDGTIAWEQLPDGKYVIEKCYNLGLSHGIPSILVFLTKAYKKDVNTAELRPIIRQTVNFLLKYATNPINSTDYYFPSKVEIDGKFEKSARLAWCYGDLGVCCALWHANEILEDTELEQTIKEVLIHNSKIKNVEATRIVDTCFCHGSVGVAQIFRRFYKRYNLPELLEASDYWYAQTLNMATHEDGLAGYKTWHTEAHGGWVKEYSFIEGITGVSAALTFKEYDYEPNWDEIFLIS